MSSRNSPVKAPQSPIFKTSMTYSPVRHVPSNKQRMSQELGFDYDDINTNGSLSSDDEENQQPTTTPNPLTVHYHALKRQTKHMENEREQLLLKISKLKERSKQQERQLNKVESERKSQLNVMKNIHEQAVMEQKKLVNLLETVIREQECELDQMREAMQRKGFGTYVDYPNSQNGVAVTRLTAQLNQVINEKNDILAQFYSQQQLIKEQQQELKGLLRCKAENTDLHATVSTLNKSVNSFTRHSEDEKKKTEKLEQDKVRLAAELEQLKQSSENSLSRQAAHKLEEHVTKLEDKLLLREAELAELDFTYRQELQKVNEENVEKDKSIHQLTQDVYHYKTQSPKVIEKVKEIPVESEASKLHLAYAQSEIKSLSTEVDKLKSEHENEIKDMTESHKKKISKLEQDLQAARNSEDVLSSMFTKRDEQEAERSQKYQQSITDLEKQLKQKKSEIAKLRQEMADKVVELEQKRDTDLEELEQKINDNMSDTVRENQKLRHNIEMITPALQQLKQDYMQLKTLCKDLQKLNQTECHSFSKRLNQAIYDVNEHNKDLVRKYRNEMALRKKFHNELVELKGNIRVFCRVRPVIKEDGPSASSVLTVDNDDEDVLIVENSKGRNQLFEMDRLFTSDVSQTQVFDEVKALVTSCIDGYHVCIFAYGQTGSGKTYTMEGPINDPGINQRALAQLFEEAGDRSRDWKFDIQVSVIEIYNEMVRDLLGGTTSDRLDIKLNQDGQLHVPGLSWVTVQNVQDVNRTFAVGHKNRSTASTNMNEHSSRSHALLCVVVTGVNRTTGVKTLGKLNLVDLAGSERVSKSGADGARLKEAQSINKSLSALGDVIAALRSKQSFVPYRNSKLTYLLQDSLGGDSKVLMIVQVAPIYRHVNETLCSLSFAQRVRSVELGMATKKVENAEISALKERLAQYEGQSPLGTPTKSVNTPLTPSRRK